MWNASNNLCGFLSEHEAWRIFSVFHKQKKEENEKHAKRHAKYLNKMWLKICTFYATTNVVAELVAVVVVEQQQTANVAINVRVRMTNESVFCT